MTARGVFETVELQLRWSAAGPALELQTKSVDLGAGTRGETAFTISTVFFSPKLGVVSSYVSGVFNIIFRLQPDTVSRIRQPERGQRENPCQVTASLARGREAVLLDF